MRRTLTGNKLESLRIKPGYVRSYNLSTKVVRCFKPEFCTPGNATNATTSGGTLNLIVTSELNLCAANHKGPFCEQCVENYIRTAQGCVGCDGDRTLSLVLPIVVLVLVILTGFWCCRSGRLKVLSDAAYESAQGGDESMIEDALQGVVSVDATQAPEAGNSQTVDVQDVTASAPSARAADPPPSPPTSPPSASGTSSDSKATPRRLSSLVHRDSLVSGSKKMAARWGCTPKRLASVQVKFRILISLVQVIAQLGIVFSIPYPNVYDQLVTIFSVFSLDFLEIMPLQCVVALNHDHYLFFRTGIPLLLAFMAWAERRRLFASANGKRVKARKHPDKALKLEKRAKGDEAVAGQLGSYVFLIFYLLYPSISANIFATFQCETLDDPGQSEFLRTDFNVDCKSTLHGITRIYAVVMVFVFPIGVPAMYTYLLFFKHRKELQLLRSLELKRIGLMNDSTNTNMLSTARTRQTRPTDAKSHLRNLLSRNSTSTRDLVELPQDVQAAVDELQAEESRLRSELPDYMQKLILGYELRSYYFEIIECVRKLLIVCLPVFFTPSGSITQLIFGLVVCFLTFGTHMLCAPYVDNADDRLAQLCQVQIFFALLSSLALKYDPLVINDPISWDVLLSILSILPLVLAFALEIDCFTAMGCFSGRLDLRRGNKHNSEKKSATVGASSVKMDIVEVASESVSSAEHI